ncbi:hypothetical protein ACVNP3_12510 [Pseudomonas chlororaphis subsp. piscium]
MTQNLLVSMASVGAKLAGDKVLEGDAVLEIVIAGKPRSYGSGCMAQIRWLLWLL